MFEHIFKYVKVRQKYSAARRISLRVTFLSLLGVWKCGEARSFAFNILHELLHLFRRRPIVIYRFAVNHLLLWLHTLQTNTSRDQEIRWETKQNSKHQPNYFVMTTTQGETPISISSIFPTCTVLEASLLKDTHQNICPSKYWSSQAAQTVTHLYCHLVGQMHLENSVFLKNPRYVTEQQVRANNSVWIYVWGITSLFTTFNPGFH